MIPARKSALFGRWFARVAERRIRGHFGAVHLAGREILERALAAGPVLVVLNHSSYWDTLWIIALARRILGADAYAMMDARHLRRLPFFAKVGAFGVDRDQPRDGVKAVRYAARLLERPGTLVFVFPQGEERPSTVRPLGFEGGAAAIARVARAATVLPMGLRYEHGSSPRPTLYAAIGPPLEPRDELAAGRLAQERAVTAQLDRIEAALGGAVDGFEVRWAWAPGRFERWAERMLAWATRGALEDRR